jgi:D-alanine-D-alanine ligase
MNPKIRVAVLLGGPTNEREISLESGRNVSYKLSPQKYEAIPVFVTNSMELYKLSHAQLVRGSTKEIAATLDESTKILWNDLPNIADFVFLGLHGGQGENGAVQGTLEMLGMPYNGSGVLTSALCMDKYKTTQFLKSKGFDVPECVLVSKQEWQKDKNEVIKKIAQKLPLPIIVKPHDDGCSVMVQKIKKIEDLSIAIQTVLDNNKDYVLVEECIAGMELTVGVIGNDNPVALPPSQAVATSDILSIEEKFLPGAGENQTPAPLPSQTLAYVQDIIANVYKALGCKGYSRIDCFYQNLEQSPTGKERVVILENNSLPGLTPATCIFHQAAEIGIKPMEFIDLIVELGFEEHKKIPSASFESHFKSNQAKEIQGLNT